jgi:hypothetical protein
MDDRTLVHVRAAESATPVPRECDAIGCERSDIRVEVRRRSYASVVVNGLCMGLSLLALLSPAHFRCSSGTRRLASVAVMPKYLSLALIFALLACSEDVSTDWRSRIPVLQPTRYVFRKVGDRNLATINGTVSNRLLRGRQ